ncbi:hypothetical protein [Jeotgalibacillus sp. JSM ZJ347]|uniref:hypothetical protein n=1 Tax=Jeotgalibacillus sp. JSM ZJ347 TaxID=3342117 RepID=UPI0035A99DEF
MRTVLFLVQTHLSSCVLLTDYLSENAGDDIHTLMRAPFFFQEEEMSEYSFEGITASRSEKGKQKTKQLQRKDLEQADMIVVISQAAEEPLTHLLKASEKEHIIMRITELSGRSMEDLEYMLQTTQTDEVIKDLKQKSVELAAKLHTNWRK